MAENDARKMLELTLDRAVSSLDSLNTLLEKLRRERGIAGPSWTDGMIKHYTPLRDTAKRVVDKLTQRLAALG